MPRIVSTGLLLFAIGFSGAACTTGAMPERQSAGYLDVPDAPLVAPYHPNGSSASAATQQQGDYFPYADAPLVSPDTRPLDARSTLEKQKASGYFPHADAPLVPKNTSGAP